MKLSIANNRTSLFALVSASLLSMSAAGSLSALAAPSGDKIFAANCQACHAGGKNMIDPKKPIIGSKKLATKETFKAFLSRAQGTMPAFNKIADNDEALTALHTYVKTLK